FAVQERIGLVGGRLAVESVPGRGTTVRAVIPLPTPNPISGRGGGPAPPAAADGRGAPDAATRAERPTARAAWAPPIAS
ncbi:MAG: hypothetical protein ACRDI2_24495, partial [Chloroflexota bacterium]